MAELVDAHDSGSCLSNGVEVRVFSSAPVIARVSECSHDWNTLKLDCYNSVTTKIFQRVPNETKLELVIRSMVELHRRIVIWGNGGTTQQQIYETE